MLFYKAEKEEVEGRWSAVQSKNEVIVCKNKLLFEKINSIDEGWNNLKNEMEVSANEISELQVNMSEMK